MRVGLGQRRRDAHRRRREDHRTGDEAAGAEDDVGPPFSQDPSAREWRRAREQQRARELDRRPARQAADPERVELEAGLRNQTRFDAIRRPGERHHHAALRERLRDRERRQHVTGRSPGCDQTPQLLLCSHDERC